MLRQASAPLFVAVLLFVVPLLKLPARHILRMSFMSWFQPTFRCRIGKAAGGWTGASPRDSSEFDTSLWVRTNTTPMLKKRRSRRR